MAITNLQKLNRLKIRNKYLEMKAHLAVRNEAIAMSSLRESNRVLNEAIINGFAGDSWILKLQEILKRRKS